MQVDPQVKGQRRKCDAALWGKIQSSSAALINVQHQVAKRAHRRHPPEGRTQTWCRVPRPARFEFSLVLSQMQRAGIYFLFSQCLLLVFVRAGGLRASRVMQVSSWSSPSPTSMCFSAIAVFFGRGSVSFQPKFCGVTCVPLGERRWDPCHPGQADRTRRYKSEAQPRKGAMASLGRR